MAWTSPKTWALNELLTSADMNTYLTDNTAYLYDTLDGALGDITNITSPATYIYSLNETNNYTTTSSTFTDIDASKLGGTITTTGGDVLIWFNGFITATQYCVVHFNVLIDSSTSVAPDDGIFMTYPMYYHAGTLGSVAYTSGVNFVRLISGLAAGEHTFTLQWKRQTTQTVTLYAGAGTTYADIHTQFGIREIT